MYARSIKSVQIGDLVFRLIALDGVPTWCHESGKIITDQNTLALIQAHA